MDAENKVLESLPVFSHHIARLEVKDKDPNYHYRWVRTSEGRVDFMKELGYELVTTKDTKTGEEGHRVVQDTILMRCPKEQFERRNEIRRRRSRMMLESPRSKVKDTAQALGVEATDSTREYRAPMSSAMQDLSDQGEAREGVITRQDVQKFNSKQE